MFLLDTGIVLELRKAKTADSDAGLTAWAAALPRQKLFIPALTLLELESAAARAGKQQPHCLARPRVHHLRLRRGA